jgi:hypothetical protein
VNPVPGAPHVSYQYSVDKYGHGWLHFICGKCGDVSRKRCENPQNALHWAQMYARVHWTCK